MTSDPGAMLGGEFAERLNRHSDISDHMQFMHDTVLRYPGAVVIEMGVRTGNSTCALLSAALRANGALWSADINEPQVPDYWQDIPAWHFRRGDSVASGTLRWMPRRADVVFMDTSHTYDQQLAELRAYVPRVRPGGAVLIHDTQCVPVDDFATDSFAPRSIPEGPVTDALDAFCKETGLSWRNRRSDPEAGHYGMGVIEIPARPKRARK